VYHYNGAQWYEQFLQVGLLDQALILCGLALYLLSISVFEVVVVLYVFKKIFVTFFAFPFGELSLVGLALDLVN